MRVTFDQANRLFVWHGTRQEAATPKDAGFEVHPWLKKWVTSRIGVAGKLVGLMTNDCVVTYESLRHAIILSEAAAGVDDTDLPVPPGLSYRPYQAVCIRRANKSNNLLIADEMGLGKTIEAIGILNSDPLARNALVICPAAVKINWQREMTKWLMWGSRITVVWAGDKIRPINLRSGVTIINYDIITRYPEIAGAKWDFVICDEAHMLKTPEAKRSAAVRAVKAKNKLMLTGTPILNTPLEIWTALNYMEPATWPSYDAFAQRYCNVRVTKYGRKPVGGRNLIELNEILRSTVMIRRMKKDVLTELPPKIRKITRLPLPGPISGLVAVEKEKARDLADCIRSIREAQSHGHGQAFDEQVGSLAKWREKIESSLSTTRRELGEAKAPIVAAYAKECLESGDQKLVVFAHHSSVIDMLEQELKKYNLVKYTGRTNSKDRQAAIDRFQVDEDVRVFLGSKAAWVGIGLFAASHCLFAEEDWVPGEISQAEDRLHRIGQVDTVLAEHLVFDGSLGAHMLTRIVEKQNVIDQAVGPSGIDVDADWWVDEL